ncbi:hypothetical protein [Cereibacter ovatus]|uniref:hypothetical protein n=1 Tax=Cereibacter ovatus TaxID=439529 RepID=UPI00195F0B48|nr:hypothetical protein [Cereibacter ovatus]
MPPAEAALVREAYAEASVILEFGSGGSTWIAAQMPDKTILSVESDRAWAHDIAARLAAESPLSMPVIHHVDIGPVGKWGKPVNSEHWTDFHRYPLAPWSVPGFPSPDVVLIDGRFRAACFLSVCINCKKPTRILFDDYKDRPNYRLVERFFKPVRMVGRMAEFHVTPLSVDSNAFQDVIPAFFQVSYAAPPAGPASEPFDVNAPMQARIKRLKRQRLLLLAPYLLALSPVLLPAALGVRLLRWSRRKCRSKVANSAPVPAKATPSVVPDRSWQHDAAPLANPSVPDIGQNRMKDEFVLYRIIGNDLEPRHAAGQSITNLGFILEHEGELTDCRKKWVLNRIYDPEQEQKLLRLLEDHRQDYIRIPFDFDEYAKIPLDFSLFPGGADFFQSADFRRLDPETQLRATVQTYRLRNNYVMHNNGARNIALATGRSEAKWVLPWDGNCFLPRCSWDDIRQAVDAQGHLKYFAVPMAWMTDNQILHGDTGSILANEEPQILFRADTVETFDEAHPYGRRPKVDLLMRLGVPGPWQHWTSDPWDLPLSQPCADSRFVGSAGWVARLSSGKAFLEASGSEASRHRALTRSRSILLTLRKLDDEVLRRRAGWYRQAMDHSADVGSPSQSFRSKHTERGS